MATQNIPKQVASARAKVASLARSRPIHDSEFVAARRELAAANLEAYVAKVVAEAPPLTPDQAARIARLLLPVPRATA